MPSLTEEGDDTSVLNGLHGSERIRRSNRNQIDGRLPAGRPRPRPIPTLDLDQVYRIFSFGLTIIKIHSQWALVLSSSILNFIMNEIYVQLDYHYSASVLFSRSSNLMLLKRKEIMKWRDYKANARKRENVRILGRTRAYMLIVKKL